MKWYHWLWAPILVVGVIVGWILAGKDDESAAEAIDTEFKILDIKAKYKTLVAEKGHAEALRLVEEEFRNEMDKLDSKAADRARSLRDNPADLAAFLVRTGTDLRRRSMRETDEKGGNGTV